MRAGSLVAFVAALVAAEPVAAQVGDPPGAVDKKIGTGTAGSDDSRGSLASPGVSLNADSDDSSASFTLGTKWEGSDGSRLDYGQVSAKVSTEIEAGGKSANFVADGGLHSGTSFELNVAKVFGKAGPSKTTRETTVRLLEKGRAACARRKPEAAKACSTADKNAIVHDKAITLDDLTADDRAALTNQSFLDATVWFLGASGAVGYKKFDYRDLAFAKQSSEKTPFSASAYVGLAPGNHGLYLGAGFAYKIDYADADKRTLCPPVVAGSPAECFTGPYAAPDRNKDSSVFAVVRKQGVITAGSLSFPVGIEIKAAYDLVDDSFGIAAPLYLVADEKGGLRGGVKLDWASKGDSFKVGVFIGKSFALFQ